MAPEQAKGKAVDKRSDLESFGCVLYEMLAGRRTFDPSTGSWQVNLIRGILQSVTGPSSEA